MKTAINSIKPGDYSYDLPEAKIAKYPLKDRSASKLLTYKKGKIDHRSFSNIIDQIPAETTLFFNDTKVIPARLFFRKETGALIEIFLLEPVAPTNDVAQAMLVTRSGQWHCMIGNLKKWKDYQILSTSLDINGSEVKLDVVLTDREKHIVKLSWDEEIPFVDIVTAIGKIPLPPYINRELEESDKQRYQTVYSHHSGAVAAPTAGLHFTEQIIEELKTKGVITDYLTLHVSAGTFQPIKVENVVEHMMHSEQVVVSLKNIETILKSNDIIAVGTTSMRTLESLYWYGVKLLKTDFRDFHIEKLFPYEFDSQELPTLKESIRAIEDYMLEKQLQTITGFTEIFLFPGYEFKACSGLVTNFHLPGSTLILLIASFIGEDWRKVYEEALRNDYRFLSYGDSSLLLP